MAGLVATAPAGPHAQKRRAPRRAAPREVTKAADVKCPSVLGRGEKTGRTFCDVLAGRDPDKGILVTLPKHTGAATLTFDLHARHTYSESESRAGRGFGHYTVVIGVLTMKGDLISRAAVQTEVRTAADLFDRIGGGAGPSGLRAVAPAGAEHVSVTIPANVDQVSLLGERLDALTSAGHQTVVLPGSPVALVSDIKVEYRPRR